MTDVLGGDFTYLLWVCLPIIAGLILGGAWRLFGLGFLAAFLLHGWRVSQQSDRLEMTRSGYARVHAVVVDTGKAERGPFIIEVREVENRAENIRGTRVKLEMLQDRFHELAYGDVIEVMGEFRTIGKARNPHGFDERAWMHRQGVDVQLVTERDVILRGVSDWHKPLRWLAQWRVKLRAQMTAGLVRDSREAKLIRAVVLGEKPPRRSSMVESFRNSGTLHVFAVSGLHVGMVGAILAFLLWFLRAPRWMFASGVLLGMSLYAGITGLNPPAVRAVLMAGVFLTGYVFRRKAVLINCLAASAVLVLLWDGHQLFTAGFQLSYGVLFAIAVMAGMWSVAYGPMAKVDAFMPEVLLSERQQRVLGWRKWLRGSLAVSTAAWMGSSPLMWIHFGIITPIGIVAGIPLMVMVFFILALAMLGVVAGSLWQPAGEVVNRANGLLARGAEWTAESFADVPCGHWHRQTTRPEGGRVVVFDLPFGGGASLIDTGGGVLLDCGRADLFYHSVLPSLNGMKVSPDSLILSHADTLHTGGMVECLDVFEPKQAMIPGVKSLSPSYRKFLGEAGGGRTKLITPRSGERFRIEDGVWIEVLHAPVELDGRGPADDSGLVLRLHWHGWRILFTGDAGYRTEQRMVDSGRDIAADVIVMGRNRADFTGSTAFYDE
ncbi:MAG: ComEC/Rec2 family competence protein, partial [Akkermansiaceae bacterium]